MSNLEVERFLQNQLEAPNVQIGHNQEYLRSSDGSRSIWSRIYYDELKHPVGASLALTVNVTNLMSINVSYQPSGRVVFRDITIGVGSHPKEVMKIGREIYSPAAISWHRISPDGVIMPYRNQFRQRTLAEFEATIVHGFFTLDLIRQDPRIDVARTNIRFINQLSGYIDDPETFEASASPSIQPELVRYNKR